MMSKKSPQLRFEGFTDGWEERKLSDLFIKGGSGGTPKSTNKAFYDGDIPFLGISDITKSNGFINNTEKHISSDGLNSSAAWIVSKGAISLAMYASVGKLAILNIDAATSQAFYNMIFDDYDLRDLVYQRLNKANELSEWNKLISTGTQSNLNADKVKNFQMYLPKNHDEIKLISTFFKQIDNTIALHQRKLDLLKEQKKGFLQKMFPKNGAKVPELRFAGFADDWEERKLSSGLREYTDRVIVEDDKEYYQISVRNNFGGITLRGSKMGNKIGRKRQAKINLTKYPQTLIFTRQTVEQGGIGWVDKYCDGAIVTENMPTISLDTSVFSKYFLTNLFQTRIFYKNAILDNVEGGSAQIAIHESKFLSSTLLFPNLDEQEKIGQFFKQLDNTITLHQRKLDLLKEQKKGFLQKMFV